MNREEAGIRAQSGERPEGGYYTSNERVQLQKFSLGRIRTLPSSVFRKNTGSGGGGRSVIGGGGGSGISNKSSAIVVRPQVSLVDQTQNSRITQTQQYVGTLQKSLNIIAANIRFLNDGIQNTSKQLKLEGLIEKKNLQDQQDSERKLNERNVRIGKENLLERRITAALSRPIVSLQKNITGLFDRIKNSLTTLFFGWLTNQLIETIRAYTEGNTKKLEEIKNHVIKNVLYSVGAFTAIKIGFDLVIRTITGLSLRLAGLTAKIVSAPFKAAGFVAAKALGASASAAKAMTTPKPSSSTGSSAAKSGSKPLSKSGGAVDNFFTSVKKIPSFFGKGAKMLGKGLPVIGTAIDVYGAGTELGKGNLAGAGLYGAAALTSLIPGLQLPSLGLSAAAFGQSMVYDSENKDKQKPATQSNKPSPPSSPLKSSSQRQSQSLPTPATSPGKSQMPVVQPQTPTTSLSRSQMPEGASSQSQIPAASMLSPGQSQGTTSLMPSPVQSQIPAASMLSPGQSQGTTSLMPSPVQSQGSVSPMPSPGQSQGTTSLMPSPVQSQGSASPMVRLQEPTTPTTPTIQPQTPVTSTNFSIKPQAPTTPTIQPQTSASPLEKSQITSQSPSFSPIQPQTPIIIQPSSIQSQPFITTEISSNQPQTSAVPIIQQQTPTSSPYSFVQLPKSIFSSNDSQSLETPTTPKSELQTPVIPSTESQSSLILQKSITQPQKSIVSSLIQSFSNFFNTSSPPLNQLQTLATPSTQSQIPVNSENQTSSQSPTTFTIPENKSQTPLLSTSVPKISTIPTSSVQSQTPITPQIQSQAKPPSPEMIRGFEMAWKYRNNPLAKGKIQQKWDQMSPEQKQQAKDWATSKGYNWKEMKLKNMETTVSNSTSIQSKVPTPPSIQPQTSAKPQIQSQTKPPSPEMIQGFEMAWKYRNNPLARGKIQQKWNELNPEQKQQAKNWAISKGYDWKEMKLKDVETVSPANIQKPQKPLNQVTSLPEPKPNIIIANSDKNETQIIGTPQEEPLTDVPFIPSGNVDNFYILYSQLSYNVVI